MGAGIIERKVMIIVARAAVNIICARWQIRRVPRQRSEAGVPVRGVVSREAHGPGCALLKRRRGLEVHDARMRRRRAVEANVGDVRRRRPRDAPVQRLDEDVGVSGARGGRDRPRHQVDVLAGLMVVGPGERPAPTVRREVAVDGLSRPTRTVWVDVVNAVLSAVEGEERSA